jgi:hypothetical protein
LGLTFYLLQFKGSDFFAPQITNLARNYQGFFLWKSSWVKYPASVTIHHVAVNETGETSIVEVAIGSLFVDDTHVITGRYQKVL